MLANEIDLHRLIWSPDDFDRETLLTSAFRRQDLSGGESDFVSVSRVDKITPEAEMEILESQAGKADGERIFREEAWSVTFICGELRSVKDASGKRPFDVTAEPTLKNLAHCGIRNITGCRKRSYINELRVLLVDSVRKRQRFDAFISEFGHKP